VNVAITSYADAPITLSSAMKLLFVCMGNICRSPTAEGVMRSLVTEAGMQDSIELDSAGTGAWHVGSPPDRRAAAVALSRGIVLDGSARQVTRGDLDEFDLLLAMDTANVRELRALATGERERAKVRLLREFDHAIAQDGDLDVPDPYYGSGDGFERAFDLVHAACTGLLTRVRTGESP
jgi:protein-tyrosine phosphatase